MKANVNEVKTERRRFSVFTTNCYINNAFINQSCKPEQASSPNISKVFLKPNSLFAFQNDDIYTSFCLENDNVTSDPGTENNDPANINFSSHCFSNCENRSHKAMKMKKETTAKGDFEEDNCNISSDIEKNFDYLLDTEPTDFKNTFRGKVDNQSGSSVDSEKGDVIIEQCIDDLNPKMKNKRFSEGSNAVKRFSKLSTEGVNDQKNYFKRCSEGADAMRATISSGTFEKLLNERLTNLEAENEMKKSQNNSIDCSVSNHSSTSPNLSFSPTKFNSSNQNIHRNTMTNPQSNFPSLQINSLPLKRGSHNIGINNFLCSQNCISQISNCNLNQVPVPVHSPIQGSPNILNSFNRGAFPNAVATPISQPNFGAIKPGINFKGGCLNIPQCGQIMSSILSNSPLMNMKGISLPTSCVPPNIYCDDKYLFENLNMLLKDQNGCRMVQKRLEEKSTDYEFICTFYEKIESILVDVINNQFGNYVVQKFFEIIQRDQILVSRFFEKIKNSLFSMSINSYGTRFFQRALECLIANYSIVETPSLNEIFKDLVEKHLLDLIVDTNGNHVFQKIILVYPKNKNQFIFDELMKNASDISKMKQGGCVLQRAFDNANSQQKHLLTWKILSYMDGLINDEYGNFIIQQIIFLKNPEFNEYILTFLKENFLQLSKKKFSSNVIDKCIILPDCGIHLPLIMHMIDSRLVNELITDQYGNYVVQKALQISDGIHFMAIIHQIKPVLKTLKQTSHGRKIYESLIIQYGDYFQEQKHLKYKNTNDGRRKSHQIGVCKDGFIK